MKKSSGLDEDPEKGIAGCGVRVSPVMVTGRQKRDASELKRVKASWSSVETVWRLDTEWFNDSMGWLRAGD